MYIQEETALETNEINIKFYIRVFTSRQEIKKKIRSNSLTFNISKCLNKYDSKSD